MLALALAFATFAQLAPNPVADARNVDARSAELDRFRAALADLEGGDQSARERLTVSATKLCSDFERCDAREVARYYVALSEQALAAGAAIEKQLLDVRAAVDAFAAAELDATEWSMRRAELLAKLDRLAESGATLEDFVPAARVHSFAARLRVEQLERDATLDDIARTKLAKAAERDVVASLAALERAGQIGPSLEPRWLSGRLARWRGARGEAKRDFERCIADAEHVGNDDFREHGLRGLVTLARDAGDSAEQERLLLEMARFRSPKTCWPLASDWASWLIHAGQAERALDFLERNEPSGEGPSGATPSDTAEWNLLMGAAALRESDSSLAREHLERAAQHGASNSAALALMRLALSDGRTSEVFERLENGVQLESLAPGDLAQALSLRGEAHLAVGEFDLARQDLGATLATADAWDSSLAADPLSANSSEGASERAVRNVVGEWIGVHTVACYALAAANDHDALEAARAIEEFQSRSLRRGASELGRLRELAGQGGEQLTREDLLAWAKSSELGLVTWVIGPDFGVAVHVSNDGAAHFARIDRSRAALEDGARRLREALIAADAGATEKLARSLGDELFPAAIRESIGANSRADARLIVLLHGPLEGLPIEQIAFGERSLDAQCNVICSPGLATRAPRTRSTKSARWKFLGAPSDSRLGQLAGAKDELETLHGLRADSDLALGAKFDRKALLEALANGGALHIATHLAPSASTSSSASRFAPIGLELAGGETFSADDVRESARELECVVLSSCASGGGRWLDGEGLQGLSRAFLETGTRNVICTLWPVSDRAARDFAIALHEQLRSGASTSSAVRAARSQLRLHGAKPADWAAFRLLGSD